MLIQFRRKSEKELLLIITRTDGTETWSQIHPGLILHDIAHYAVEKVLEFKNGFFGIIDSGVEIEDFESHESRNKIPILTTLPIEAIQTEHIVNLLQIEYLQKTEQQSFMKTLQDVFKSNDLSFPIMLNDDNLKEIREEFYNLADKLIALQSGDLLQLELKII